MSVSLREACFIANFHRVGWRTFCFMNTNEDSEAIIICETKMKVSVYITNGGGIAIEQLDPMMNDAGLIIIHKSDVSPLIRALSKLKKSL